MSLLLLKRILLQHWYNIIYIYRWLLKNSCKALVFSDDSHSLAFISSQKQLLRKQFSSFKGTHIHVVFRLHRRHTKAIVVSYLTLFYINETTIRMKSSRSNTRRIEGDILSMCSSLWFGDICRNSRCIFRRFKDFLVEVDIKGALWIMSC